MLIRMVLGFAIGYVLGNWGKEKIVSEMAAGSSDDETVAEGGQSEMTAGLVTEETFSVEALACGADDLGEVTEPAEESAAIMADGADTKSDIADVADINSADLSDEKDDSSLPPLSRDDLTVINGVGPVFARRLSEGGIANYEQLVAADEKTIYDLLDVKPWQKVEIDEWQAQARELLASR